MWKLVGLIRRKPGLSAAAFEEYYETTHVPLAVPFLKPYAIAYRRTYVRQAFGYAAQMDGEAGMSQTPYDCVTEIICKDRQTLDAMLARLAEPDVQAVLGPDEERFSDRQAAIVLVGEAAGEQA